MLGTALGGSLGVALRDAGATLTPVRKKDWKGWRLEIPLPDGELEGMKEGLADTEVTQVTQVINPLPERDTDDDFWVTSPEEDEEDEVTAPRALEPTDDLMTSDQTGGHPEVIVPSPLPERGNDLGDLGDLTNKDSPQRGLFPDKTYQVGQQVLVIASGTVGEVLGVNAPYCYLRYWDSPQGYSQKHHYSELEPIQHSPLPQLPKH